MAVHKVNKTPPAWICSAVAAHASAGAVYTHAWLSTKTAYCVLVILHNYKDSYKLSTVLLKVISPKGRPGGLGVKAPTMNHKVPGSFPAGNFCCMSFPTSHSSHFLLSLCCHHLIKLKKSVMATPIRLPCCLWVIFNFGHMLTIGRPNYDRASNF